MQKSTYCHFSVTGCSAATNVQSGQVQEINVRSKLLLFFGALQIKLNCKAEVIILLYSCCCAKYMESFSAML